MRDAEVILMWFKLILDRWLYPPALYNGKPPGNPIVNILRQAVLKGDNQEILRCLEYLNGLMGGLSCYDFAEVRVQGARTAFSGEDPRAAERYLKEAIQKFGPARFPAALAYWMLGCVLWSDPKRSKEAVFYWSMCLREMDELSRMLFPSREDLARYRTCLEEMKMALERAVQTSQLPPPSCLP